MECAKVKGFLSEYIDGVLDAQVKKLVEEHLSACKSCSEELASLKACIKELSGLKGVEAPGDFLEKVHERIERRAGFGKIIQALFIPVRIKIPFEIAAVAAMVILTINLMQSERKTAYMPAKPEGEAMAKKTAEEPIMTVMPQGEEMAKIAVGSPFVPELERDVAEQPVPPAAPASQPPVEEKPIELALLVKETPYETYDLKKESRASRLEISAMKAAPSEKEEAGAGTGYELYQYEPRKKTEAAKKEDKIVVASPYLGEAISKVKNLVELVDGKVTSVQETPMQYITAEIPAKNYSLFVEKLSSLGELQKPLPSVTAEDKETVQLRINFMPYK